LHVIFAIPTTWCYAELEGSIEVSVRDWENMPKKEHLQEAYATRFQLKAALFTNHLALEEEFW